MEVTGGLITDVRPYKMQDGEWLDARNIVLSKQYRGISNENGFHIYGCSNSTLPIIGIIPLNEGYIEFRTDNINSSITIVNKDGTCRCIIADSGLGFNLENPIRGVYQYNYSGQLNIAFWEGLNESANPPRILNLNCLPFEVDGDCKLVNPEDIILLNQFGCVNCVDINLIRVNNTGGNLKSGVYYFAIAYKYTDGSKTNWFEISNQVSIYENSDNEVFSFIDGIEAGSNTNKSISLQFGNLDTRYDKLCIAVVSKIGGVLQSKLVTELNITGSSKQFTYTGSQFVQDLDITEIVIPTITYDRIQAGTIYEDRLYYANVRTPEKPNLQCYVNNISVEWCAEDRLEISNYEESYKNPNNIYYLRNFRSFAVYAFFLVVHMKDGTKYAYHIPGRSAQFININGTDYGEIGLAQAVISDNNDVDNTFQEAVNVQSDVKIYQVIDTARTDGTMGFWYNEDENYNGTDCWNVKDCDGNIISNFKGNKVRHHRFPSIETLNEVYGDVIETANNDDRTIIEYDPIDFQNTGTFRRLIYDITYNVPGIAISQTDTNNRIKFLTNKAVTIEYFLDFDDIDHQFGWNLYIERIDGTEEVIETGQVNEGILPFNFTNDVTLQGSYKTIIYDNEELVLDIFYVDGTGGIFATQPDISVNSFVRIECDDISFNPVKKRILGVKLTNVCIPDEWKDKITCYELGYAERTDINNIVFDQDAIEYDNNTLTFRGHPFDTLYNKSNPRIDLIKTYYKFNDEDSIFLHEDRTPFYVTRKVEKSTFVPANVTVPINNNGLEEVIYGEVDNSIGDSSYYLVDFIRLSSNLYLDYNSYNIVRTGYKFDVDTTNTNKIYGGDSFHSIYGVFKNRRFSNGTNYTINNKGIGFVFPVESINNIGLRHSEDFNHYYPFDAQYDNSYSNVEGSEDQINQYTQGLAYNNDYTSVNNISQIFGEDCKEKCTEDEQTNYFPTRIVRSVASNREEFSPNWRTFLSNSYYEMPRNKGEIWTLNVYNKALMIQNKFALFIAENKDVLLSNNIEIALGRGDIFTREPDEIIPEQGGYIGCNSYWASFVCKAGYVVVDAVTKERGKIFIFNGKVDEISNNGNRIFFRDNMYLSNNDVDNPFNGQGWTAAFDEYENRILFTKKGLTQTIGNVPARYPDSYTISFDLNYQKWVCKHDYIPNMLFWDRGHIFSVQNNGLNNVYRHNIKGRFGYYYNTEDNGVPFRSWVDIVHVQGYQITKQWINFHWQTDIEHPSDNRVYYDKTITHIMLYNHHQCSGEIVLIKNTNLNSKTGEIRHNEYTWYFSDFRDLVKDRDDYILFNDGTLNQANIENNKAWFKRSRFASKFLVSRLIYDNTEQLCLHIEDVEPHLKKADRI